MSYNFQNRAHRNLKRSALMPYRIRPNLLLVLNFPTDFVLVTLTNLFSDSMDLIDCGTNDVAVEAFYLRVLLLENS